jgi:hypothetical protein
LLTDQQAIMVKRETDPTFAVKFLHAEGIQMQMLTDGKSFTFKPSDVSGTRMCGVRIASQWALVDSARYTAEMGMTPESVPGAQIATNLFLESGEWGSGVLLQAHQCPVHLRSRTLEMFSESTVTITQTVMPNSGQLRAEQAEDHFQFSLKSNMAKRSQPLKLALNNGFSKSCLLTYDAHKALSVKPVLCVGHVTPNISAIYLIQIHTHVRMDHTWYV